MNAQASVAGRRRRRVAPVGQLEYLVESRRGDRLETWWIVRPHASFAPRCAALGLALTPGCRVVVDANSLRPIGVLESIPSPAPMPSGYNPYFDLPAA